MSTTPRRRPVAAIVTATVLTLAVAGAGAAYALTENDRQAAALSHSSAKLARVEKDLTAEIAGLRTVGADAAAPLDVPTSRVLDESVRSSLASAVRKAATAADEADLTLRTPTAIPAPRGFRWFWDDSAPVRAVEQRITALTRSLDDARAADAAVQNGISRIGQAVTAWDADQVSTLEESADVVNVTAAFDYDGTVPSLDAEQVLLDAGGILATTYPDSKLTVVTTNSYVNPVPLTVETGDLITFSGALTGTYVVAEITDIAPWTLPTAFPEDAVGLTAMNWDSNLARFLILTPYDS